MMPMNKKKDTSWGEVADWYHEAVDRKGSYQSELILPNILRMASIKKGERVLDVACGEGFFSAEFARSGAVVVGTDISPELLAIAAKRAPSVKFIKALADDLSALSDGEFDKAFIILALQNMEYAAEAIGECSKKMKKGGKMYVVLNHPCFRIPEHSSWGWDDNVQYRKIERYLSETKSHILMRPGSDPDVKTISFHRPLQYFFKSFDKAGMAVTRLEEWNSSKMSEPGPRAAAENRARKEIPLFAAFECSKL